MSKRELTIMYRNAAGIDIGSASHYVAVEFMNIKKLFLESADEAIKY